MVVVWGRRGGFGVYQIKKFKVVCAERDGGQRGPRRAGGSNGAVLVCSALYLF